MAVEQKDIARILEDTQANARALPDVKQKQFIQYRVGADKFRTEIKDGATWRKLDIEGTFVKTDQINRFSKLQEFGANLSTDGAVSYVASLDGLGSGDFRTGKLGALGVGWNLQVYNGTSWVDVLDVNDAGDNINTPRLTQQTKYLEVVNKQEFIDPSYTIYREQGFNPSMDYGYRDYIERFGTTGTINLFEMIVGENKITEANIVAADSKFLKDILEQSASIRVENSIAFFESKAWSDGLATTEIGLGARKITVSSSATQNKINSTTHELELQYAGTTELTVDSGLVTVANDLAVDGVAIFRGVLSKDNVYSYGSAINENIEIGSFNENAVDIGRAYKYFLTAMGSQVNFVFKLQKKIRGSSAINDTGFEIDQFGKVSTTALQLGSNPTNSSQVGNRLYNDNRYAKLTGNTFPTTAGGAGNERLWLDGTTVKYS